MAGMIGKKIGMTSIFDEDRKSIACTLLEVGPCTITQIKTEETDGYNAVQLGWGERKEKNVSQAYIGHFKKAKSAPARQVKEFRDAVTEDMKVGDTITAEYFEEGEFVDVTAKSKGKGFQGVVKRHGFHGVGGSTHGQHNRERAPGSIGAGSTPSRVFKGMKMGGRMGHTTIKIQNLKVMKVVPEKNLVVVSGAVPGKKGSTIIIEK